MKRIKFRMIVLALFSGLLIAQEIGANECEINDLKCVQKKIETGEYVDYFRKNSLGKTTLFYAIEANNLDLVKLIVQNNIGILDIEDKKGNTVLHQAVILNHKAIVDYLLQNELDINRIDRNGETALDLANANGNIEIRESILAMGGKIGKSGSSETTLWVYAAYIILSISITVWVARTLYQNGKVFLLDAFHNQELADSVNHLLVVGFYLINLGYITLALKIGLKPTGSVEALEILSTKLGLVILILGVMHFFNLYLFGRLRKRTLLKKELGITENRDVVKPAS